MKIRKVNKEGDSPDYMIFCDGCGHGHGVWTSAPNKEGAIWKFNGDMENPTITPSILVYEIDGETKQKKTVCHSFVTNGMIQYLNDSVHKLAGQTVPLTDF